MKLIPRYISITVIGTILLILLILMGLELLISFIGELSSIGTGNYGLLQALRFILLDMPHQLYNFFPMAGLIGSLLGLGVLANQSELIVMQASGFSKGQITLTVIKVALVMVAIAMVLGEVVAPFSEHAANKVRAYAKSSGKALETNQGFWLHKADRFIHIRSVENRRRLLGISSYRFNSQHQLVVATSAKEADYHNHRWQLFDVKESSIDNNKVSSTSYPKLTWNISINPKLLGISGDGPREMSLIQLHHYINYLKENGLRPSLYELNYWKRMIQPFATAVMIFLAIPFVFGSLRTVTMGVRILIGVTVGFSFYILNQFFGPLSLLYQIPPIVGALLPTLLFVIAATVLLFRVRA